MRKILINNNSWQTRIAITWHDELENIYFASHAEESLERAFFKGVITKVLPGIQTAFVDIGQPKAGFLHISEIDHELAMERISKHTQLDDEDEPRRDIAFRKQLDISKILKEGDTILVQVNKEPVYEKGAKLTTCFTLPGRFIVLMPNIPRLGVSKRIENREERLRLKELVRQYLPEGMGGIIRTTSENHGQKEISKDINFLLKTWHTLQEKYAAAKPLEKVHEDLDISLQVVRDHLDDVVDTVITDSKKNQAEIFRFVKIIAPEHSHKIKFYTGQSNIFEFYNIEKQIEHTLQKKVPLKSGGSLIIESTEAMTVIDVNTGRFTGKANLEETIFKTNMEAAETIARQLRLRNIGGLIVIDFIDMAIPNNRQKLFRHFEKMLKEYDKFQSVVLKLSEFGLVQMTRKRSGKTLIQQLTDTCPQCKGMGFITSLRTDAYMLLRSIKQDLIANKYPPSITITLHPTLFEYITTTEYNAILELEQISRAKITLNSDHKLEAHAYKIEKS